MADLDKDGTIFVGKSGSKPEVLTLALANRHGLVTGATGTGKTVTLQVLAEGLSRAGVSVFAADIKGDLSGVSEMGEAKEAFVSRAKSLGFDYESDQFPVVFWDLFGEQGHPVRATISEVGPLLLSRLMDLNEVQEGVLNICFRVADEQGLLILNLKDLRAMLGYLAEHAAEPELLAGVGREPEQQLVRPHPQVVEKAGDHERGVHGPALQEIEGDEVVGRVVAQRHGDHAGASPERPSRPALSTIAPWPTTRISQIASATCWSVSRM